jgi:Predicted xylanase/chitin deacetylase
MLVLLYHKVIKNLGFDLWWRTFDLQIKILKITYKIVSLDEVLDCVINGKCQKNAVAITFDDGYADNYIYAYPILKKHKVKATLFLATSRVLLEDKKRPTLLDYWEGKVSWEELYRPKSMKDANAEFVKQGRSTDFLTLEEIKGMKDVFSFGWHSHWH